MLTGKLATRLQVSQWVLLKILGQDFENRTAHPHPIFDQKNMRQQRQSLVSISGYPKAREKRNGDEVESISRHHRIYESHVHHLASLTKKKQTEKLRVLGKT